MKKIKYLLVFALALSLVGCSNPSENVADGSVHDSVIVEENDSADAEISDDASDDEYISSDDEAADHTEEEDYTEEAADYTEEADHILSQIDTFFDALAAGDIDTLVEMCDEEQEYYEYLVEMSEFDCTPDFLRALYGNTRYYISEDAREELIEDLEAAYEDGEEYVSVDVTFSHQYLFLLSKFYPTTYENGAFITEKRNYSNNNEAIADLAKTAANIPYGSSQDFYVKLEDDGDVTIVVDTVLENMEIEEIGRINEKYPMRYAEEVLEQGSDMIVGDIGKGFFEDNDFIVEFDRLLTAKDFVGLEQHLSATAGEDFHAEYTEKYGSYDELTAEQKAFVDDYINKFEYQLIGSTDADEDHRTYQYRDATFVLAHPKFDMNDAELTQWYWDNDIKDYSITYDGTATITQYKEFLWRYYYVIQYAIKNK